MLVHSSGHCAPRGQAGDGVTHPLSWGALFSLSRQRQTNMDAERMLNTGVSKEGYSAGICPEMFTHRLTGCFRLKIQANK